MNENISDITEDERYILASLKRRWGLYISKNTLTAFADWVSGYAGALTMTKLYTERIILPYGLHEYAALKYLGNTETVEAWQTLILKNEPDEKKALEIFWEILDEYLLSLGYKPLPSWEEAKAEWEKRRSKGEIGNA